jgi:hypothetical protein
LAEQQRHGHLPTWLLHVLLLAEWQLHPEWRVYHEKLCGKTLREMPHPRSNAEFYPEESAAVA